MIFSNEDAFNIAKQEIDYQYLFDNLLRDIAETYSFESIILCGLDENDGGINILASYNISTAPFLGSHKEIFVETIEECFRNFPKPHVHKISADFKNTLMKFKPSKTFSFRMAFVPIVHQNSKYIFLGFPSDKEFKTIPEEIYSELSEIIVPIHLLGQAENLQSKLNVLQNYVKEVGHDISSAVQATIAKLRNISRGIFAGELAKTKAKEAEEEIFGAFRIAENLGFTVDPDYNTKEGIFFNILETARSVIGHYKSEAAERHIDIQLFSDSKRIEVWGDRRGLESAIGQYLFNAIKYAFGSSYIKVRVSETSKDVCVDVTDKGIPLEGDEKTEIWEFGYRGKNALERHVNGAGIGLYTVKKIVSAHGGIVSAKSSVPNIVTFSFSIPKKELLQKTKLL